LLSKNPNLVRILNSRYSRNQSFFPYVDGLAKYLRVRVQLLREKAAEAGNLQDFDSFVSELRFAVALCAMGSTVKMISTSSWTSPGQVPDFICCQNNLEVFFEAKRAKEGEGTTELTRSLQDYLRSKQYEVTVDVKPKWTNPTNNPVSRLKRKRLANDSIQRFRALFPCPLIRTKYATYETRAIQSAPGYANIVTGYRGDISIRKYLRGAARKAGEKRQSWVTQHPSIPYVAAIENEEPGAADDITISQSFLGLNLRGGAFKNDPKLRSLSGVLVKNGTTFYFVHNPHAYRSIRPQGFGRFLPPSFRVPWYNRFGGYL